MVRREVRETGRGTSRRGPSGRPDGHPARRPLRSRRVFLDTGMRPLSNACSGEPGEYPDSEVNAHLGNPGLRTGRADKFWTVPPKRGIGVRPAKLCIEVCQR